ncbi:MAG: hypothetical protein MRQ13_01575 [Candidatus Midichloria sp.]|nr:hypothetical protein [Candidatus Midichloria sp.]
MVKYIQILPDYTQFDIVEINPDLKQIAKDFFFFDENRKTKVFIEDAYQYVSKASAYKKSR